jgi:hypothetical protein
MSANIAFGKMVYSQSLPMWHGLGTVNDKEQTAEQTMNETFLGGFPIELRQYSYPLNGQTVEDGDCVIVRGACKYSPLEVKLGVCTSKFHPLQPAEVATCFDENVNRPVETMGFLGQGEDMFISWKMPSFEVKVGDELKLFGVVRTGFDTMHGPRLMTSIFRPVCQNTITMAERWSEQNSDGNGKGMIWKGKGTSLNLLRDMGYWMKHVEQNAEREQALLKDFFALLAKTPVKSQKEADEIIYEAYPDSGDLSGYWPEELRQTKQETTLEFNQKQEGIRYGIGTLFAGAGAGITPDWYGLVNATSEYFCHYQPSKRPISGSVMWGARSKLTTRMMTVLKDRVEA